MAKKNKLPCYSIGNLIHNPDTVRQFEEKGLKVISKPSDGVKGIALIRAHGIPDSLRRDFVTNGFTLFDSTCANIQKTRELLQKAAKKKKPIIVLGIKGHAETECLIGTEYEQGKQIDSILISTKDDLSKLDQYPESTPFFVVTQTTFPEELYKEITTIIQSKFKNTDFGNKLCQACSIRKNKSLELAKNVDVIVVVGGKNSENTRNLAAFIKDSGKQVLSIENVHDIDRKTEEFLKGYSKVGICSGTSTPLEIINEVCDYLEKLSCSITSGKKADLQKVHRLVE